jgi:hypothetical protein
VSGLNARLAGVFQPGAAASSYWPRLPVPVMNDHVLDCAYTHSRRGFHASRCCRSAPGKPAASKPRGRGSPFLFEAADPHRGERMVEIGRAGTAHSRQPCVCSGKCYRRKFPDTGVFGKPNVGMPHQMTPGPRAVALDSFLACWAVPVPRVVGLASELPTRLLFGWRGGPLLGGGGPRAGPGLGTWPLRGWGRPPSARSLGKRSPSGLGDLHADNHDRSFAGLHEFRRRGCKAAKNQAAQHASREAMRQQNRFAVAQRRTGEQPERPALFGAENPFNWDHRHSPTIPEASHLRAVLVR